MVDIFCNPKLHFIEFQEAKICYRVEHVVLLEQTLKYGIPLGAETRGGFGPLVSTLVTDITSLYICH